MKKPVHRTFLLEDAVLSLMEMETTFARLENSEVFQTFTRKEKTAYRDSLRRLRDLIHNLEKDPYAKVGTKMQAGRGAARPPQSRSSPQNDG